MKHFFAAFFGTITGLILLIFLVFGMFASLVEDEPIIADTGFLVINLSGSIPDFSNQSELEAAFGGSSVSIYGIYESLYKAAADDRIKGILFKGSISSLSLAGFQEIKTAVESFRMTTDKPVYYFTEYLLNGGLLFSTICDSSFVVPEAVVALSGISLVSTHYQEGLEKLGIEADFIAIGKYKNAPEVYTRNDLSSTSKEVYNEILDYAWEEFLSNLAAKAGKSTADVEKDIASGIFDAMTAKELGYIDDVIYRDQLIDLIGEDNELISFSSYSRVSRKSLDLYKGNSIALIFASGSIMTGGDTDDPLMGQSMGSNRVTADIRAAVRDKTVKAIVFRINSPGGMASASDIIWRELIQAREEKPVIISIGALCASGGYYMAMAGDSIIAHPGSIVGSIGVYAGKFVTRELFEDKLGIHSDRLSRGAHSGLFSPNKKFDRDERILLHASLTRFYKRFVTKAAERRNTTFEEIDNIAQGRVWIGNNNIDTKLVDSFGNLEDAFKAALVKAGLDTDKPYRWKVFPKPVDLLTELQSKANLVWTSPIEQLESALKSWTKEPHILARFPYEVEIK